MQNQNLTQTYLDLKQPSNTSNFKHKEHKNSNKWSSHGNPPNANICFLLQYQTIQNILGYPVTQIIFDEQGDIILDIGDLITYQAVERAIKANVFKKLLEAVYIKK